MGKYALEFRVVEYHYYEVEADSLSEAEDRVFDEDLEPEEINPICYELDPDGNTGCLDGGDDFYEDEEDLSPADYDRLRTENLDWLQGKESINDN